MGAAHGARAARLMELLGLSEDELCRTLDSDPLTLLSGQLEHGSELPILLDLLDEAAERAGAPVLRRWVRAAGPSGGPSTRWCAGISRPSRTHSTSWPRVASCCAAGGEWVSRSSTG